MKFFQKLFGGKNTDNNSLANEITHINQEMYKKSAELAERNKTLALLQNLDAIILGSITRLNEIAQLVTSLLVKEADFENISIFLYDPKNKLLQRLAFSETQKPVKIEYTTTISLSQTTNLIVESVTTRLTKTTPSLNNVLLSAVESQKPEVQQALQHIKTVQIYPLIVRNEILGVLVLSLTQEEQSISEYRRDLLVRVADTIGIALDNALLYNEVQAANERLKQLDKLKDEFVSVASHELRTPMTAIQSYLWMALEGKGNGDPNKHKYYLQRAYNSVGRLMRLVGDMLNVSRIDSGRITIILAEVDLQKLVQEVFEEVMPKAQEWGVKVAMTPVSTLPHVLADGDKIKEVLFNLVGNAIKFTPFNGTITVSFVQKGELIETVVSDTGTGIDPKNIGKLFTKFGMVQESYISNRSIQGSGLGLYICKSVIELHGGKIWVTSAGKDKGTQFTFSLKVFHEGDVSKTVEGSTLPDQQQLGIIHTKI